VLDANSFSVINCIECYVVPCTEHFDAITVRVLSESTLATKASKLQNWKSTPNCLCFRGNSI